MRFSIIMPVLNEAAVLEQQLCQLARLCDPYECELLIVDGGSVDATVAIARRFGRVIAAPRGRAAQMNGGAAVATGDIYIFLHADSMLPDGAFTAIERACAAPGVVGGAFRLCFNCSRLAYRLVAFTTNLRSRWRGIFTGDQAYFVRAESFQAIGGFPDIALMEDIEIITRLRAIGRLVLLPDYVITSARRHRKVGLARSVLLMWYLRALYRCGVSPELLQRKYVDVR
ncbi:MAG TPA: TIGR04283 family arsenosugar biosynthesis glycosyltransferase [Ktedonobacteraceae bacterium]|nr:TIGR04283 family arsenosugar biosynthesis glycosyltransferase [Ktedonobacteraceae bacterium]